MFQNMFPPIQPQNTKVNTIKRVLLISKDKTTGQIELRHYSINTKLVEESKSVKKLIQSHHNLKKKLPKMTNAQDVADLILDPYAIGGLTSDSEVEDDAVVEVQHEEFLKRQSQQNENQPQQQESITTSKKRAIKLIELGPRINMSLLKIEEGLVGSSKTLYHSSVSKSTEEAQKLDAKHKLKEKLKQERRAKQQAAVQAKLDKKKAKKDRKKTRFAGEGGEDKADDGSSGDEGADEDEDMPEINAEDYENDSDLYSDVEV